MQRRAQRRLRQCQGRPQPLAVTFQTRNQCGEPISTDQPGQGGNKSGCHHRQAGLARPVQGRARIGILHHAKMRRNLRFQRKAAQQRLAKRMNSADAHAARQIQHAHEQRPGARPRHFIRRDLQRFQRCIQAVIVHGDKATQPALQADRHLSRGRLGERQAKDARRIGARQH